MHGEVAELVREVAALPDDWRSFRLGDVAILSGGTTPSRAEPAYWEHATVPWATPSDITSLPTAVNQIDKTETKVTEKALAECSLTLNPPGTVLMTSRATIGFAAINQVPMATNQGFITFRAGDNVDADFLLYWLTAQRSNLVAAAGGSTFKELSRGTAKLLPILLPTLDEQRRIAKVLRSVDEAIASESEYEQQAKAVRGALLQEHFHMGDWADGSPLPDGWQLPLLDQVAVRGSGHTPNKKMPEYWNGGIKWVSLQDTKRLDQVYISETAQQISADGIANSSAVLHPAGVVVISRDATVGRSAITVEEMAVSQHFIAYRCGPDLDNHYLYYWLQRMKPVFERIGAGSTIKTIGLPFFKGLRIALPPLGWQKEIAASLLDMDQSIMASQRTLTSLVKVKAALMSDLLSGRVRVPA